MKMRGYSVLLVCALCVFVLCVAAAVVVAQDVMPENVIANEAKDIAAMAKGKGDKALEHYGEFKNFTGNAVDELSKAVNNMNTSKGIADTLSLPGEVPSKGGIEIIEKLITKVKNAVDALITLDVHSFSIQNRKDELTNKMTDVVSKVIKMEQAAAAVTEENISTIDAVIERAAELRAAAEGARDLWTGAQIKMTTQMGKLDAADAAFNTVKSDMENAKKEFANNKSPETMTLNLILTFISTKLLTPVLDGITSSKTFLQNATNAAEGAKNKYRELAAKAEKLKGKAEERKEKVQPRVSHAVAHKGVPLNEGRPPADLPGDTATHQSGHPPENSSGASATQETEDYSPAPFCSLALPAFFFCLCVLFGM